MSTEYKQSYLLELGLYIGLKDPFLKFPAINHLLPKSVGGLQTYHRLKDKVLVAVILEHRTL